MSTSVGIVESSKALKDMDWSFAADKNRAGIAYDGDASGRIYDGLHGNGGVGIDDEWEYPQEIVLTLDMSVNDNIDRKHGRLLMKKGNAAEKTIYDKIDMDKEYRLAVAFFLTYENHKIQLVQD